MEAELFAFIERYIPLAEEEKAMLRGMSLFRHFRKGEVFLREGDVVDRQFFVLKGCVRCFYWVDGEEKTTDFYTELQTVVPRQHGQAGTAAYNLACVEDSILLVGTADMEQELFASFPRFEKLCRLLTEQLLSQTHTALDTFKTTSAEDRYRQLLATRPGLVQRVPLQQLASYLGIRPESLSRIRRRVAKESVSARQG